MNHRFYYFFFLLFLNLIRNGYNQEYDSIMVESKLWSVLSGGYVAEMEECCYQTTFIKFAVDTQINTIDEKQVLISTDSLKTWTKIGSIKESEQKIYFRDLENNQGLLYDFGIQVGEIIKIVNFSINLNNDTIVVKVQNIDTLNYLGIDRKRIGVIDTLEGQTDIWIEGIGSEKGLLNPCLLIAGGFRELLCVYNNSNQIYQNFKRMTCYLEDIPIGIQEVELKGINFLLNQTDGIITIKGINQVRGLELKIFNSIGQQIHNEKMNNNILQLDLNRGIYVLSITDNGTPIYVKKLIICE
jgi:hypothetical protein